MKSLFSKYYSDNLSLEELESFRQGLASASGDEIDSELERIWTSVGRSKSRGLAMSGIKTAVAVTLCLLALFFFYRGDKYKAEVQSLAAQEVSFETGVGERASITLPDGTKVMLNCTSSLKYNSGLYNSSERVVSFDGEAYFDVEKNPDRPFVINSDGLQVRVLGTSFDLKTYKNHDYVVLVLDEGKVSFKSLLSNEEVIVNKNETLKMEINTGRCEIIRTGDDVCAASWRDGVLQFRNEPLRSIVDAVKNQYGVDMVISDRSLGEESFTGTLPADNLMKVISILEYTYVMHSKIDGDTIVLYR